MKTITIFNHKGGVSKTTTTFHLGWKLGQLGKKVLLVDADPQCNLTGLMLGEKFDDYYSGPQSKNNIMDGVKPTFDGRPIPIKVVECVQSPDNKNVYLLPGHMDLSQFEPTLGLALNSNNAVVTLQNLPGSFYSLIELCAQQYDIDYVLIDMNPGLSSINQSLFMSSDGFIVPMNPDPFSLMALKTLTKVLPRWKKWAENSRGLFDEATYRLPNCEMQFLGAIMQRFNLRKSLPAKAFQVKIDEIQDYISSSLVPTLQKSNMVVNIPQDVAKRYKKDYTIAEISDFGSLIQRSMQYSVPVFALNDKQMENTGVVLNTMKKRQQQFDQQYSNMAQILIGIMEAMK